VQYWTIIVLSLAIPAAALLGEDTNAAVVTNATLVSLGLLGFGAFALFDLDGVQDVGQLACGLWLMASPLWLDYSDAELRYVHVLSGAVPVLLATYNCWLDRPLPSGSLGEKPVDRN
jgi:hypothetical protein